MKGIIYTHFHADHIAGARVFAGDDHPDVFSHETTAALAADSYELLRPIIMARSLRQFGVMLSPASRLNCGIGSRLRVSGVDTSGFIPANRTVDEELEVTLAGGTQKLIEAAEQALNEGNHQWVLELTDWIRRLEPNNAEVKAMRKEAAIALGKNQISANGRNYYLSAANQGK